MMVGRKKKNRFPKLLTVFLRTAAPSSHEWKYVFLNECQKNQSGRPVKFLESGPRF